MIYKSASKYCFIYYNIISVHFGIKTSPNFFPICIAFLLCRYIYKKNYLRFFEKKKSPTLSPFVVELY